MVLNEILLWVVIVDMVNGNWWLFTSRYKYCWYDDFDFWGKNC